MAHIDLKEIRRYFHARPEVSEKEKETAREVVNLLKRLHPDEVHENVGGYGVMAVYKGAKPGKTVVLRCELDALPIEEINTFSYKSKKQGVSHKCGHEGHLTTMLGVAEKLHQQPLEKGKVVLLFQPAEENGAGAVAVIKDERFIQLNPDYIFAWHNLPGFPLHQIIYKEGSFSTSVISIIIKFKGITSHAGEPEKGINPGGAIAEALQKALEMDKNDPDHPDFTVITPVYINMGEKSYGVSAGYGELHITMRTWSEENLTLLRDKIKNMVYAIGESENIGIEIEWKEHFSATHNHKEVIGYIKEAAEKSNLDALKIPYPFKWGEDFGVFTQKMKGAMFGIGAGENCPALHNPDYDFPDELLESGINMYFSILKNVLES